MPESPLEGGSTPPRINEPSFPFPTHPDRKSPADEAGPPIPRILLADTDGDPVGGSLATGGYRLQLYMRGATIQFPTADRAAEHAEEIKEALAILNRALARAHRAHELPLPEPVDCRHGIRLEHHEGLDAAVCPACNTILVRDVREWADRNGYGNGGITVGAAILRSLRR